MGMPGRSMLVTPRQSGPPVRTELKNCRNSGDDALPEQVRRAALDGRTLCLDGRACVHDGGLRRGERNIGRGRGELSAPFCIAHGPRRGGK